MLAGARECQEDVMFCLEKNCNCAFFRENVRFQNFSSNLCSIKATNFKMPAAKHPAVKG